LTFLAHTFKHVLQGLKSVRSTGNVYALKLHNTNSIFGQFHMRGDKIQIFKEVAHVIIPCSTLLTSNEAHGKIKSSSLVPTMYLGGPQSKHLAF